MEPARSMARYFFIFIYLLEWKTETGLERPAYLKESVLNFSGLVPIIWRKKTNVNRKNTQLDAGTGRRKSDEKRRKKVKIPKTLS